MSGGCDGPDTTGLPWPLPWPLPCSHVSHNKTTSRVSHNKTKQPSSRLICPFGACAPGSRVVRMNLVRTCRCRSGGAARHVQLARLSGLSAVLCCGLGGSEAVATAAGRVAPRLYLATQASA